jgi:hypothetical protein
MDISKVGAYTMKVTGYFTGMPPASYKSSLFPLKVTPDCSTQTIIASTLSDQSYTISAIQMDYVFPTFTSSCPSCFTLCPVVYIVTLSDGSAIDSSLITLDMATRTISLYSIDNLKAGTYILKVTGYFTGMPIGSY